MSHVAEKGGAGFHGIKLLLCENPLPPLDEAVAAAQAEVSHSNYYTEPYSAPLRQLFERFGRQVHMLTPTYVLFPEIAKRYTETRLLPEQDFRFDLADLEIPDGTTLAVIVNPNNPNGGSFDMSPLPGLLQRYPDTRFLVDEAFIGLAGFRVGYAILPEAIADDLNAHNDAYPLARPSQAAAIATLRHEDKIHARAAQLHTWTRALAAQLRDLGVRTYPTETYFFLADFAPHGAATLAERLRERDILVKPLNDARLGKGFMRVTTALPEDNARFLEVLQGLL